MIEVGIHFGCDHICKCELPLKCPLVQGIYDSRNSVHSILLHIPLIDYPYHFAPLNPSSPAILVRSEVNVISACVTASVVKIFTHTLSVLGSGHLGCLNLGCCKCTPHSCYCCQCENLSGQRNIRIPFQDSCRCGNQITQLHSGVYCLLLLLQPLFFRNRFLLYC